MGSRILAIFDRLMLKFDTSVLAHIGLWKTDRSVMSEKQTYLLRNTDLPSAESRKEGA